MNSPAVSEGTSPLVTHPHPFAQTPAIHSIRTLSDSASDLPVVRLPVVDENCILLPDGTLHEAPPLVRTHVAQLQNTLNATQAALVGVNIGQYQRSCQIFSVSSKIASDIKLCRSIVQNELILTLRSESTVSDAPSDRCYHRNSETALMHMFSETLARISSHIYELLEINNPH